MVVSIIICGEEKRKTNASRVATPFWPDISSHSIYVSWTCACIVAWLAACLVVGQSLLIVIHDLLCIFCHDILLSS
ncbi:hypothetical protein T4B_13 [Trichinella pseudospiralis]|uniref:Uncharacterized protein n=1 Tax=Trichinella pseudospiralis TaxID=6337 RepID=A0A0V1JA41_TRIPS|nr:hypothetical protein T4B_13 [Trichinella pseudospiralis]